MVEQTSWRERLGQRTWLAAAGIVIALYLVVVLALGVYWSDEPDSLELGSRDIPGQLTTGALIGVVETLLNKPGGFLSNDIAPPGVWLDNIPAWEYGALVQSRDLARAMRESLSRSQSQSREDSDLARAEPRLHFSNNSWALPASESEYRQALVHLRSYRERLGEGGDADFYARADNLNAWLGMAQTRLGSLSLRLSASVGKLQVHPGTAVAPESDSGELERTPWTEIDDVFYEARGSSWALLQFLRAVRRDFAPVLEDKNAEASVAQIIRELEGTQQALWSPVVLNGDGFGLLANHSLVLASYIGRANAAMIDLRDLLSQG